MCAVGRRNRASKKPCSNPYADRGLDKFALVSAELESKRQRLIAQLGSSLSLVRFAIGSDDSKWIPIIICPTLSKAEIRFFRRAATHLITEDKPAASLETSHEVRTSVSEKHTQSSRFSEEESLALTGITPTPATFAHAGDHQIGALPGLISALERFLCMCTFMLSILADTVSNAIVPKRHAEVPRTSIPLTRKPAEESVSINEPSTARPSCARIFPVLNQKSTKAITPPHSLHVEAPTTHHRWKTGGFSTAPSTPRDSREARKPCLASISLPKTSHLQEPASDMVDAKDTRLITSVSQARAARLQEPNVHKVLRSSSSTARQAVYKEERSEKVGPALTGAGLVLGLIGLLMGYVPAILSVVCWWYALPSLRKAVGDQPFVKSHRH